MDPSVSLMLSGVEFVPLPGGAFLMGSDDFYPEERPRHERWVDPFELSRTPVTNAQFAAFVHATGYVTIAERELPESQFPQLGPEERAPGSLVFTPTAGPVDLGDWRQWWRWVPGASWRRPGGPGTSLVGLEHHPVVQVSLADARAFAEWVGARLPTEAEFEYAAGAGAVPEPYAWGPERDVAGEPQANTWRGRFPYRNDGVLGWAGTSPVGSFPENPFGLSDCIGNVWEWTGSEYTRDHLGAAARAARGAVGAAGAGGAAERAGTDAPVSSGRPLDHPGTTGAETTGIEITGADGIERSGAAEQGCGCSGGAPAPSTPTAPRAFVLKGGSHLCAPEYCHRYRPAARSSQSEDSATSHIGFRVARSRPRPA